MSDILKPRRTHLSNDVYRLRGGNEDNDLWVRKGVTEDKHPIICSTWVPTEDQRRADRRGGEPRVDHLGHPAATCLGSPR